MKMRGKNAISGGVTRARRTKKAEGGKCDVLALGRWHRGRGGARPSKGDGNREKKVGRVLGEERATGKRKYSGRRGEESFRAGARKHCSRLGRGGSEKGQPFLIKEIKIGARRKTCGKRKKGQLNGRGGGANKSTVRACQGKVRTCDPERTQNFSIERVMEWSDFTTLGGQIPLERKSELGRHNDGSRFFPF